MSFQDLQAIIWSDDAGLCPECGEPLHAGNVSVEAFEMNDELVCVDCAFADSEEEGDE